MRKGSKSSTVVKYGTFEREDAETGEERRLPYLKAYRVFNAEQIDGLSTEHYGTPAEPALDAFFAGIGVEIRTGDDLRAYYDPMADFIHLPPISTLL